MHKKKLFIILLNWNSGNLTIKCLNSLRSVKSKLSKIEILVVDNNSTDNSLENIKIHYPNIKVIRNKDNFGFSKGNNVGIKYALKKKAEYVMILNPDTVVSGNFIDPLIEGLMENKETGIAGPKIYDLSNKRTIVFAGGKFKKNRLFGIHIGNGKKDAGQYKKNLVVDYITGACMIIKKDVFKKVGFFEEKYFLYYEDADFCVKAKKSGLLSLFVPSSFIFHKSSSVVKVNSPIQKYYTTRNHLLFVERNALPFIKLREFVRLPKTIWEFYKSSNSLEKQYSLLGIRDYLFRRFGRRIYW